VMSAVNQRRDTRVVQEARSRVFLRRLLLVQDHLDLHASLRSFHEGFVPCL
jgi:hypothetical protein